MHSDNGIHLVTTGSTASRGVGPEAPRPIEATDIVRETLLILQECYPALTKSDQLLVDLVTSLVFLRLQKAGGR
jgi:hypothetical protein